jgi:hypothetical protein
LFLRGLEKAEFGRYTPISPILAPIGHSGGSFGPQQAKLSTRFWESRHLRSIWISGAFSKLKITPNSTYWKAKVGYDRLVDEEGVVDSGRGERGVL